MTEDLSKYRLFFHPGDLLYLGIHLPDRGFAEDAAIVIHLDGMEMTVELCSSGFPSHLEISPGMKGVISRCEGRNIYQCRTLLKGVVTGRLLKLQLVDQPSIKERREYSRMDVNIKVHYELPPSQDLGRVINEWERLKSCSGRCPESRSAEAYKCHAVNDKKEARVNLSANGLRFKINDCLSYGTLLHLNIGIPGDQDQHVHAIGSIVRTRELLPEMKHNVYYSTSMSFRMIDSHDRNKLMEYILRQQRKAIL